MPLTPGTRLGPYEIREPLGAGGMGEVYRARDPRLERTVAVKVLPAELADAERLRRFEQEARAAGALNHPNLLTVFDVGTHADRPYLVTELLEGKTLRERLAGSALPVSAAVDYAIQIARGLSAAHDKGVVHRDLKPENVFLTSDGVVKVLDFGLAKVLREDQAIDGEAPTSALVTGPGVVIGTLGYMSPEQLRGEPVSGTSDIFALGVVLYEMLSGRRPFVGNTAAETIAAILTRDPPPLPELRRQIPGPLDRIVRRCLAKRPEERFGSARDLALALAAVVEQGPGRAASGWVAEEVAAPTRAGLAPTTAWISLAWVVLALAATVWLASRWRLLQIIPLPKSTEILVADARSTLESVGYTSRGRDSTYGFTRDLAYIEHLMQAPRTRDWWRLLARGEPSVIRFWYRESPRYLVPHRTTEFFATEHDPPPAVPGMVSVQLDTLGRVRRLQAVPLPSADASGDAAVQANWSPLFDAARLEFERFSPVEPTGVAGTLADQWRAWEGFLPDAPEVAVRVEAASLRGQPIAFRIIEPWSQGETAGDNDWVSPSDAVATVEWARVVHTGLHLLLLLVLAVLARHNLAHGRGDRRLAFRLASFFLALVLLQWLFGAHHVPDTAELELLFGALYRGGFAFGLAWLFYVALEPYARRLWPRTLDSWVALLEGRFRDPRLGRDVLVGCAYATTGAFVFQLSKLAPGWLGRIPPRPDLPVHPAQLIALRGIGASLAELFSICLNIAIHILFLIVALLLFRYLLRRTWLALALHGSLYVLVYGTTGFPFSAIVFWIALWYLVFFHFGWLPMALGTLLADMLAGYPLTSDLTAWYAYATVLPIGVCLALAAYGFKVSLAGRPALRDLLAED